MAATEGSPRREFSQIALQADTGLLEKQQRLLGLLIPVLRCEHRTIRLPDDPIFGLELVLHFGQGLWYFISKSSINSNESCNARTWPFGLLRSDTQFQLHVRTSCHVASVHYIPPVARYGQLVAVGSARRTAQTLRQSDPLPLSAAHRHAHNEFQSMRGTEFHHMPKFL